MAEVATYRKAATELLELFKYLDRSLMRQIPNELIEKIEESKDTDYEFKVDESIPFKDQNIMPITRKIFGSIYLEYCCTKEKKKELVNGNIMLNNAKRMDVQEIFNSTKYADEYKAAKKAEEQKEKQKMQNVSLVDVESMPWYKKIFNKIRSIFKR